MSQERHIEMQGKIFGRCLHAVDIIKGSGLSEKKFPVEQVREAFDEALRNHDTLLFQAQTGAGKSVDLPVMVLRALDGVARIAVTQPRRDAAENVSTAIAARHGLKFGEDVCFSTSEFKGNRDNTTIQLQTTALLLQKFRRDPMLEYYDVVIIDEAHERDIHIDLCLGMVKRANILRKEQGKKPLKIVIASATINEEKFAEYFSINTSARFSVEGRMFSVETTYLPPKEKLDEDAFSQEKEVPYTTLAAKKVQEILASTKDGDILVFMPGLRKIQDTISQIGDVSRYGAEVCSLHGSDTMEHRSRILSGRKSPRIPRRVVISTNMAETSVTVPHIRYVIDSCRKNENTFDVNRNLSGLFEVPATRAECAQRRGRAGRIQSGEYYPLLTEDDFLKLEGFPVPEIQRSELSDVVLRMLVMGIKDIENFPFLDKLPERNVIAAIRLLEGLGIIDSFEKRNLTDIGRRVAEIPLEPRLALMVVRARESGCVKEIVEMAAAVTLFDEIFRHKPIKIEFQKAEDLLRAVERGDVLSGGDDAAFGHLLSHYKKLCSNKNTAQKTKEDERGRYRRTLAQACLDEKRASFSKKFSSDWIMLWCVIAEYRQLDERAKERYCDMRGFDSATLERIVRNIFSIEKQLHDGGVKITSNPKDYEAMSIAVAAAFGHDHLIAKVHGKGGRYAYKKLAQWEGPQCSFGGNSVADPERAGQAIALHFLNSVGKAKDFLGDQREIRRTYALGIHPLTSEMLYKALPHLIERIEMSDWGFDAEGQRVFVNHAYRYKPTGMSLERSSVYDETEASARVLAERAVKSFYSQSFSAEFREILQLDRNNELAKRLDSLVDRHIFLPGNNDVHIAWPGLSIWYAKRLGTASSLASVRKLGKECFSLEIQDFIASELVDDIERRAPSQIVVRGAIIPCVYGKCFEDGKHLRRIVLDVRELSEDMLHSISSEDISQALKANVSGYPKGDIVIRYLGREAMHDDRGRHDFYDSFEKIKEVELARRREDMWWDFTRTNDYQVYTERSIEIPLLSGVAPSLESLGIRPVTYGVYAGVNLVAYPALHCTQTYDGNMLATVRLYRNSSDADGEQEYFERAYKAGFEEEQRKRDVENVDYVNEVRARFAEIEKQMDHSKLEREFGYEGYGKIRDLYLSANRYLTSSSVDPRKADACILEIMQIFKDRDGLAESREKLLPNLIARKTAVEDVISLVFHKKLSYRYGLNREEQESLISAWGDMDEKIRLPFGNPRDIDELLKRFEALGESPKVKMWLSGDAAKFINLEQRGLIEAQIGISQGEFFSLPDHNALEEIPLIGNGHALIPSRDTDGSTLLWIYANNRFGKTMKIPDGNYAISRDAQDFFAINVDAQGRLIGVVQEVVPVEVKGKSFSPKSSKKKVSVGPINEDPNPIVAGLRKAQEREGIEAARKALEEQERALREEEIRRRSQEASRLAQEEQAKMTPERAQELRKKIDLLGALAGAISSSFFGPRPKGNDLTKQQKALTNLLDTGGKIREAYGEISKRDILQQPADVLRSDIARLMSELLQAINKYRGVMGFSKITSDACEEILQNARKYIKNHQDIADFPEFIKDVDSFVDAIYKDSSPALSLALSRLVGNSQKDDDVSELEGSLEKIVKDHLSKIQY